MFIFLIFDFIIEVFILEVIIVNDIENSSDDIEIILEIL